MLTELLRLGARWTFVGGKGGVGKTTTAAALAVSLAEEGDRVLVLSTDPAHSLGDALGARLGSDPTPISGVPGLEAMEIDAEAERGRFLSTRRGQLLSLIEEGTYLDRSDVEGLVDLAVPGMDEVAALFRLVELANDASRRLVIDTAPTGHTLRLLDLPGLARAWVAALRAMEQKHALVVDAFTRGRLIDSEHGALVREMADELDRFDAMLRDSARTRFVLVTNPEPVVMAETLRYEQALDERSIALAGVVVNRARKDVPESARGQGMVFVPPLSNSLTGVHGARSFAAAAAAEPGRMGDAAAAPAARVRIAGPARVPLDRRLYIVGGKGGVGKSTAAAAIACELAAARPGPVLLLSIDPAGSLDEALGLHVGDAPTRVTGAPCLLARQLDAPAAWERFRREYQEHARELFDGMLAPGLTAGADQAVVERLIDLAPSGIDELVALLEVIDLTEDRPYDALVVDTAPTGHLVRLLEMPDLVLQWARMLLRLLLKYRQVVGLGELGEKVLDLAKSVRSLRSRLGDPEHTWLLAVALPESLSVPETRRLTRRLAELGVPASALLINRLLRPDGTPAAIGAAAEELVAGSGEPAYAAPDLQTGPVGPERLRDFLAGWRELEKGYAHSK